MKSIRAFAPATVANVCCGFDILGFAVDNPGDEVRLTLRDDDLVQVISIEGDGGKLPREAEKNTASVAVLSFLKSIGSKQGVDIELKKNLPLGSGMGSSAASGAAALVAINELLGNPLTREQLVPHAMEAERIACGSAHADNVAPSLLGGFVLVRNYHPLDIIKIEATESLYCSLIHPHLELKTEDSRKVLRHSVSLKDVVTQTGNIAGLMLGLTKPDYALIGRSLNDVIAEPTRSAFIPGFDTMRSMVIDSGALGFGISGSGPTVFALSETLAKAQAVARTVQIEFEKRQLKADVFVSKVNPLGAYVINE
ncbi:MAG TPA: homoserine kinase [Cyclobacteriaceae bacterium]|nr:homoserine kinase [Cytophagales bacterium]HMR58214.1 homoserine kinase [Cyclobacteriaceae bacterium]HRE66920.1 homoserine kinase [Cyclobacteriaceae bacterium]HRF34211.1 homoserine kinase [Cyclobacteriaceae bacterium]